MAEPAIQIKGMKELQQKLKSLIKSIKEPKKFFGTASIIMYKDTMKHFKEEMGPKGKWKSLEIGTLISRRRAKGSGGLKILQSKGELIDSIEPIFTNKKAEVGTNKKYANMHQKGGTIPARVVKPRKKKVLHWIGVSPGGITNFFSKGHKIPETKIPARSFVWYSKEAENRILGNFLLHLKRGVT